jgi:hypothetical protein
MRNAAAGVDGEVAAVCADRSDAVAPATRLVLGVEAHIQRRPTCINLASLYRDCVFPPLATVEVPYPEKVSWRSTKAP